MTERVRIPLDVPSLIERTDGALVFTARDRAAYVDLATWPPRIIERDEYTLDAARGADATWLAYVKRDSAWTLRWYRDDDATPFRDEPEPVPQRDFGQFTHKLDATSASIEAAHRQRIESVHVCGGDAIVVPRHVGLGERRHPYVHRDGAWYEAVALPAFTKSVDDLRDRCCTAALRLGDGTDVLVWDGHVFAYDGTTFAHRFEQRLALAWFRDYAPVAFGRDRLFVCSDHKLVELGPDGMRTHLPGVKASSVMRGPGHTLLVTTSTEPLLFSPGDDSVASIDPDLLGRHGDVIGASGDGVVVHDTRERWLSLISAADLAALPRRRASEVPVVVPPPPQPLFDALGAASRPLVAGHGEAIVVIADRQLRFHIVDRPLGMGTHSDALVAVAHDDRGGVVLGSTGILCTVAPPSSQSNEATFAQLRKLPGTMRSLAVGPGDAWLVLAAETTFLVDFDAPTPVELPFAAPIAAATDADGTVLLVGEDRRLATWSNGALVDIPPALEQVVACVAVGRGRFVCAGQHHLCVLDVATRELELLQLPKGADDPDGYAAAVTPYLAASPNGTRIAWGRSRTSVEIAALDGTRLAPIDSVYYPSEYSGPDEPLAIHGLAFLDDHRLVILLDRGRANIVDLDSKQTLKLDPQPGDVPARWIFIYAGQTLIAD